MYNSNMANLTTRMCDQNGCDLPASYYLVFQKPLYCCGFHTAQLVGTGDAMGYNTPRLTKRPLETHEKLVISVEDEA